MVYPRVRHTQEPAAVFRQFGDARVVYFPGDIARTSWRSGNPDLSHLLINSVRWLLGGQLPVSVQGEGMMELFAWETEPGYSLHVLNYTNPHMTKPFVREFYRIGPLHVELKMPGGKHISTVKALKLGRELPFTQAAGRVTFELPSVRDYEVVALSL